MAGAVGGSEFHGPAERVFDGKFVCCSVVLFDVELVLREVRVDSGELYFGPVLCFFFVLVSMAIQLVCRFWVFGAFALVVRRFG